ncbi:MAG: GNAT family N-acetyltransferase [Acidimicrobiales bacterium]
MTARDADHHGVRTLRTEELLEAARLVGRTMLASVSDEVTERWAAMFEGDTTHGAISSDGEVVGVARWFGTDLSLDGPSIRAACVTAVAVLSTHRRQGHLRRLMDAQLESIAAAEVPIALLVAAEWPIYGRYGFGPAVDACGIELDAAAARFVAAPIGSIELVGPADLRPHLEAAHDRRWARTMGAVTRDSDTWDHIAGVRQWPNETSDPGHARGALWRDDSGAVQGAVAYRVEEGWTRNRPTGKLHVQLLVGATPVAERELWRHLSDTDWVSTVVAGNRSVHDPLPLWLEDARAAVQLDHFDCIWARILDVPSVLRHRRAPIAGGAVLEVVDDLGFASGRWALDLGPDGAEVSPTSESADLRLPVRALGAASLGGTSLARLQQAGWLDEERPGGVARLDALLRTPTAPWSPTTY